MQRDDIWVAGFEGFELSMEPKEPASPSMFGILESQARHKPKRTTFEELLREEYTGLLHEQMKDFNRQWYTGFEARIPVKVRPRARISRHCDQGMFARLHDWDITRTAALPCYDCYGRLEHGDSEGDIVPCRNCISGWIPARWTFRCKRCDKYESKGFGDPDQWIDDV